VHAIAADPVVEAVPPPDVHFDVSLEAVVLTREQTENFTILQDTVVGTEILGSGDFDFGWEPGADARLGIGMGSFGLAARFFGGFNWDDSESLTTPVIWNLPTTPPLFGLGVANIDADYDSELHTGELDLTYSPFGQVQFLAGARALVLDESLDLNADFGGNTALISTTADTWGIGPQLGLLFNANLPGTRFFLDGELRGGYLFTESDLDFGVQQAIGPAFAAAGDPEGETFFGEGSVAARFQFNQYAGIRVGYTVLFVDDIPTAPSSVGGVDVLNATVDHTSDQLLAHGARVGFVGRF
jgi:hypothetical protein